MSPELLNGTSRESRGEKETCESATHATKILAVRIAIG